MNLNRKFAVICLLALLFGLTACSKQNKSDPKLHNLPDNIAMVLSVSSDGNYAVTSNLNMQLILWDIKDHTHKVIATNTNIYSAYFIKNTHYYMWQNDDTNEVNIANTNGQSIQSFNPGFPTYGQTMSSNEQYYFASDESWNIFRINNDHKIIVKKALWAPDFFGVGKLLNLTLSNDDKILLTSGDGATEADSVPISYGQGSDGDKHWSRSLVAGVVTWDVETGKPLRKFPGNSVKTFATLSPDGKYIVSGDENDNGFVWHTKSGKLKFKLWLLWSGKSLGKDPKTLTYKYDDSQLKLKPPKDFAQYAGSRNEFQASAILSIKFIDNTHYLRFTKGVPYVILYSVDSPQPLKYIKIAGPIQNVDFTKERYPAVAEYVRDQAIDTAPKAHILVMGQQKGNGIIVFKYDPKTMTLKKIWVGNFCGPRSGNPKCW